MTKINGASHNQASSSISNNKKDKNIEKEKIGYKDSYGYGDSEYGH